MELISPERAGGRTIMRMAERKEVEREGSREGRM
jgi:hypothetical protein